MLIKVACACGCRYSFDVVPVNGMMPVGVTCPKCGLDGTAKADALIAMVMPRPAVSSPPPVLAPAGVLQAIPLPADATDDDPAIPVARVILPGTPVPAPQPPAIVLPPSRPPAIALPPDSPSVPSVPMSAPPPAALPEAPAAPSAGGLKVGRRNHGGPSAPVAAPGSPVQTSPQPLRGLVIKGVAPSNYVPPAAPVASTGVRRLTSTEHSPSESSLENPHVRIGYMPKDGPEPSIPRGVLGAFIGTVAGALIWYTIYYFGDIDFGWLALLPAVMSGMLARKMAREDNTWIGVTAAVFTFIAIFGTRYAIATREFEGDLGGADPESFYQTYDERMAEAKEAVAAKTDDDIKNFLQNQRRREFEKIAEKGEKYQPEGITNDEVEEFKEIDLPDYQEFVNGMPSREEYEAEIEEDKQATTGAVRAGTAIGVIISTGIVGLFPLIFALCVAYRTGSG